MYIISIKVLLKYCNIHECGGNTVPPAMTIVSQEPPESIIIYNVSLLRTVELEGFFF